MKNFSPTLFAFFILLSCSKDSPLPAPTPTVTYTLSVSASEGGTVNTTGGTYNENSNVLITATADAGYEFTSWSGDASGTDNPLTVSMNSNKAITANFIRTQSDISLALSDNSIDQVNAGVGKWNIKRRKKRTGTSGSESTRFTSLILNSKTTTSTTNTYTVVPEYIDDLIGPIVTQVQELIELEFNIYTDIDSQFNYIREDVLGRAPEIENIKNSLGLAEEYHNLAIEQRNIAISITKEYVEDAFLLIEGEEGYEEQIAAYELSNSYVDRISSLINGDFEGLSIRNSARLATDQLQQITEDALEFFDVSNEENLRLAINEYKSIFEQIQNFNDQSRNLLYNQIYPNSLEPLWINSYSELPYNQEKINLFPIKLIEINAKVIEFREYYDEALSIQENAAIYINGLTFTSSQKRARLELYDLVPEATYRLSVQNAWKKSLLYRYIEAKVGLLLGPEGDLGQQYNAVFELTEGREHLYGQFNELVRIIQQQLEGLDVIQDEETMLIPQFPSIDISFEGWESYDSQFEIARDWNERESLQAELEVRISESSNN